MAGDGNGRENSFKERSFADFDIDPLSLDAEGNDKVCTQGKPASSRSAWMAQGVAFEWRAAQKITRFVSNPLLVEGCQSAVRCRMTPVPRKSALHCWWCCVRQVLDLIEENNTLSVEVRELRSRLAQQAADARAAASGPSPEAVAEMQVSDSGFQRVSLVSVPANGIQLAAATAARTVSIVPSTQAHQPHT